MPETTPPPAQQTGRKGQSLFLIMLGIIVAFLALFLVIRPNPSGTSHNTNTSEHGSGVTSGSGAAAHTK